MPKSITRVVVPDSHGEAIDEAAARAFLADLAALAPQEIVFLGDHVNVEGGWSGHQPNYKHDLEYSYYADLQAATEFLDAISEACQKFRGYYLEGNHEQHVERWAARNLAAADVEGFCDDLAPHRKLRLKERGIEFFSRSDMHHGLKIPNTIKLGKCYFTHGTRSPRHAATAYLAMFGENVVFGHTHRAQSYISKTISCDAIGAWCPGTLSKLQPLYLHSTPSEWSHGYAVQFVQPSGRFLHVNVPIVGGDSLLPEVMKSK